MSHASPSDREKEWTGTHDKSSDLGMHDGSIYVALLWKRDLLEHSALLLLVVLCVLQDYRVSDYPLFLRISI